MSIQNISTITSVDLRGIVKTKPILVIAAGGEVPTTGWTDPRLIPHVYKRPPQEGIYDFDFHAYHLAVTLD